MKRLLVCVFLLIPVALFAQVSPNVNVPANGVASTVIPVSSSYQNGNVVRVTNGSTSTDCTVGGGTNVVLCYWTGSAWAPASGSGTGSVTSFSAGALSPLFTTSTATAATTPALSFFLNTQNANLIFAGPSSGSAAAPTFRALGLADLPSTLAQFTGTITPTHCAEWFSSGVLEDAGAACGAGGGFTAGGDLSGTSTSQTVIGLQGKSLAAPTTSNTFPEYNGTSIVWAAGTGTTNPGGANTDVQFNNSGAFSGSANFTWNNTNQALAENGTFTVSGLLNPPAPVLSISGTAGATSYSYAVVAEQGSATTAEGAVATINTGNATLSATNYNIVTTPSVAGATACDVYRTASGGSPSTTGKIGTVSCGSALNDTGLTASGSAPASNGTGTIMAANFVTSGAGAGFTEWTSGSLSPGVSGTVLCGANSNSYLACSFNGGALALMPALANDLGGTDPTNPQVVGFHLTNEGQTDNSPVTFSIANDTTTGTTEYKLAKIVNESGTPYAIAAATTDTAIPVYMTASATAASGNARLVTAGTVGTCTFDGAGAIGDYVEASTTAAGDCHDAGATAPTSGFVLGELTGPVLATPAAPSVALGSGVTAGTTTITYEYLARTPNGASALSTAATITDAPATLNGTEYIAITPPTVTGATQCGIYRTATNGTSPTTTGKIGTATCGSTFDDTGLPGDGTTPLSGSNSPVKALAFNAAGGSAFQVNGTALSSSSTVNFQSGSGVAVSNPSAGNVSIAEAPATVFFSGVHGGSQQIADTNTVLASGFYLPYPVTFSYISFVVNTADTTSGDHYDVGIYSHAGTLEADIGATAGTTAFGSTGSKDVVIAQTSVTLAPGEYYLAFTGNAAIGAIDFSACGTFHSINGTSFGSSSGGALPSSLTPPADAFTSWGDCVDFVLH